LPLLIVTVAPSRAETNVRKSLCETLDLNLYGKAVSAQICQFLHCEQSSRSHGFSSALHCHLRPQLRGMGNRGSLLCLIVICFRWKPRKLVSR
jgi:hypothetical protein